MEPADTNKCLFLDPGKLADYILKLDKGTMSTEYLLKAMHYAQADSKKFILVPYHQRLLPVINLCILFILVPYYICTLLIHIDCYSSLPI
jgi:hypothetical protein